MIGATSAEVQTGRFQVIQTLGDVNIIKGFHRLQFNQNQVLDQDIAHLLSDHHTAIMNRNPNLLNHGHPPLANFVCQRVFVHFFQESASKRVTHRVRIPDNYPRQFF